MWDVVKTVIVIIKVKSNLSDDDKCSDDNMMIHVFITCTIHELQLCTVGYILHRSLRVLWHLGVLGLKN